MRLLIGLILGLCLCSDTWADPWSPTGQAQVFLNSEGIRVTVIPLPPVGKKPRSVVMRSGTQTPIDGIPVLTTLRDERNRADYLRYPDGGIVLTAVGSTNRYLEVLIPGRRGGVRVFYHPKESSKVDADGLLKTLLYRRQTGSKQGLSGVTEKDRKKFSQALSSANKSCQSSMIAKISDANFKKSATLAIGKACSQVMDAIALLCADDIGRNAVRQQIKKVQCTLGDAVDLKLKRGELQFQTAIDSPAQDQFAFQWLEESLE